MIISVSLACGGREVVEFQIQRAVRRKNSRVQTLHVRGADFYLFWGLVEESQGRQL